MFERLLSLLKRKGILGFLKTLLFRVCLGILALPIVFLILLLLPILRIRFIRLFSYRIGHYALNTELFLCAQDRKIFNDKKLTKTFFYTLPNEPICNQQLHKMWKRVITILPFSNLCYQIDIMLLYFSENYRQDAFKKHFESAAGARDLWNLLETCKSPHLAFTQEEHERGRELLKEFGLKPGSKLVCLLGRDSNYLKNHLPGLDWSYHDYRDVTIQNYASTMLYLANQGYYIFRMGTHVQDKFKIDHQNIIDYANHPKRTDFLDIYLSATCYFFISPRSGIDAVAQIFRKPLLLINFPLCLYRSLYFLELFIPKKVFDFTKNRYLTFEEMSQEIDNATLVDVLKKKIWAFEENSSEEMLSVVKEMLGRLARNWEDSEESNALQKRFWQKIPKDLVNMSKIRIGGDFLKENAVLLE